MSGRLVGEVLDHAPADLTYAEVVLLVALAERANDTTRECWPSPVELRRRCRVNTDRAVRRLLQGLADKGCEVRVAVTADKHGQPVYGVPGQQRRYRIPDFGKVDGSSPPKADGSWSEGGEEVVVRRTVRRRPNPQEPSGEPSNSSSPTTSGSKKAASESPPFPTDDDLAQIRHATGGDLDHARRCIAFAQGRADGPIRSVAYVLTCIANDPYRYGPARRNPTKDTCCPVPGHAAYFADRCVGCLLDAKHDPELLDEPDLPSVGVALAEPDEPNWLED